MRFDIIDFRKTREGKVIAVLLAISLAFMGFSFAAFAGDGAQKADAPAPVAVESVDATDAADPNDSTDEEAPAANEASSDAVSQVTKEPSKPSKQEGESAKADAPEPEGKPSVATPSEGKKDESDKQEAASSEEAASQEAAEADQQQVEPEQQATEEEPVDAPAFEATVTVDGLLGMFGGITVQVSAAEGVIPAGTTVSAERVSSSAIEQALAASEEAENRTLEDYVAIDVTLHDPDGNAIQPDGLVNVRFVNNGVSEDAASTHAIYHVADDASSAQEIGHVEATAAVASFNTDHFSIFAITEGIAIATYNFYASHDADAPMNTQVVKAGEKLYPIDTPSNSANERFMGWYDQNGNEVVFDEPLQTSGGTYDVYPRFETVYHATFMAEAEGSVWKTVEVKSGEMLDLSTIEAPESESADKAFSHWADEQGQAVSGKVEVNQDRTFVPVFDKAYWVTFHSNEGSAVSSQHVVSGKTATKPADPVKSGSRFAGWYTNEEQAVSGSGRTYDFATPVTGDLDLYAAWAASDAEYTVIVWKQKVTDRMGLADEEKSYDYEASYSETAKSGSRVSVASAHKNYEFAGFGYARCDEAKTVAADGSTVLNVYYDRKVISITFNGLEQTPVTYQGLFGQTLEAAGYTWPATVDGTPVLWRTSDGINMTFMDAFLLPNQNDTSITFNKAGAGRELVSFYKQNADGSWPDQPNISVGSSGGVFHITDKYSGYVAFEYKADNGDWTRLDEKGANGIYTSVRDYDTLEIRYQRAAYNVDFVNGSETLVTERLPYEGSLSELTGSHALADDQCPDVAKRGGYEFAGWFADPECTTLFDFDITMPSNNLVVYAGWQPKTFGVTLDAQAPGITATYEGAPQDAGKALVPFGSTMDPEQTMANGEALTPGNDSVRPGYKFVGWYTDAACTNKYNFDDPVKGELVLYGKWFKTSTYGVEYVTNQPDVSVTDANKYYDGSQVVLAEGCQAPEGQYFYGWYDAVTDTTYRGNAVLTIDSAKYEGDVITLTAVYKQKGDYTATVTYKANGGAGDDKQVKYEASNSVQTAEGAIFTKEGATLIGWSLEPGDFNEVLVEAGGQFDPGYTAKDSSYTLYAVWGYELTLNGNNGQVTYDATQQSVTGFQEDAPEGEGATVTIDGKTFLVKGYTHVVQGTDVGIYEGEVTTPAGSVAGTVTLDGQDVSAWTTVHVAPGTLEIAPAPLTVVTPNAEKVYDGTPLTAEGTIEGFVGGETATFTTTGSQTAVGSSENTYELVFDQTAKESNYVVEAGVGTLTVTEYADAIIVATVGGTFGYDAEPHGAIVSVDGLPAGYEVQTARSDATVTHVAEGTVRASCDELVIVNAQGEDVTNRLNITFVDGSLSIIPALLSVKTQSAAKVYDGEPLTAEGTVDGFVNGETATFATTGSQTTVGESTNTYEIAWDGTAAQSDYRIEEELGTLTVTESEDEIVVTTTGGTFVYDGEPHGATVTVSELPTGYTLMEASSDATATHVADGTVEATCDTLKIVNAEGEDVTSRLNITYVNGSITIQPTPLTVTTPSATKTYDGEPLTAEGSIEGFVNGEEATFTTTGSQTAVGSSENTYELIFDKSAQESDYAVDASTGTLTVEEYSLVLDVICEGGEFVYDGQSHGATVIVTMPSSGRSLRAAPLPESVLPQGYTVEEASSDATVTHVAESPVEATCDHLVIKNAQGEDVTSRLNLNFVSGQLRVIPATLTVVTPSATKVYGGTPLTAEGSIEGFVNGEEATFTTTGSQTSVGTSENTYELVFDKTAQESDYVVNATTGTLTVTETTEEIVVATTGGEFVYDGEPHGATVEVLNLPAGYSVDTATSDATATHVADGTVEATCDTLKIVNAEGEDVTERLNITYADGSITIKPAPLTVLTESATKTYDGAPLTAGGSVSGFAGEETATLETTGSQTLVGASDNTYTLTFDQTAAESDYTVTAELGTLTVTDGTEEDPVDPSKVITKSHEGESFGLGETVTFTITVINIYDEVKTITIEELPGVTITGESVFEGVQPGQIVSTTAEYTITEADILAGSFTNKATARFSGTDKTYDGEDPVPTDPVDNRLAVSKRSDVPEGQTAAFGQTITYTITVTNLGNVTVNDIAVDDPLTGNTGDAALQVGSLAPGESRDVTVTYVVTEDDIHAGHVTNVATAHGTDPNGDPTEETTQTDDPTDTPKPSLFVSKTAGLEPGQTASLGQTLTYVVTVLNNGNVTIADIDVADELEGTELAEGEVASGITLAPGESVDVKFTYTVTEADILAGSIHNVATATGTDPDDNEPEVTPGTSDDPTDPAKAALTVTKTSDKGGQRVTVGDTVTYSVTVENTGNLTVSDIEIEDSLVDSATFVGDWSGVLAPGEKVTFEYAYTVTEADAEAGSVGNVATARGTDPNGDPTDAEDETQNPVDPQTAPDPDPADGDDPDPDDGNNAGTGDKGKGGNDNGTAKSNAPKTGDLLAGTLALLLAATVAAAGVFGFSTRRVRAQRLSLESRARHRNR